MNEKTDELRAEVERIAEEFDRPGSRDSVVDGKTIARVLRAALAPSKPKSIYEDYGRAEVWAQEEAERCGLLKKAWMHAPGHPEYRDCPDGPSCRCVDYHDGEMPIPGWDCFAEPRRAARWKEERLDLHAMR